MKKYTLLACAWFVLFAWASESNAQDNGYPWLVERFEKDTVAIKKLTQYTCHCFQEINAQGVADSFETSNRVFEKVYQCFFQEMKKHKQVLGLKEIHDNAFVYIANPEYTKYGTGLRLLTTTMRAYMERDCSHLFERRLARDISFKKEMAEMMQKNDSTLKALTLESKKMEAEYKKSAKENTKEGNVTLKKIQGDFPAILTVEQEDKTEERIWILALPTSSTHPDFYKNTEIDKDIILNLPAYKGKKLYIKAYKEPIYNAKTKKEEKVWVLKSITFPEKIEK